MFEIGKTYSIKNIDAPYEGEITILGKMDKQGTTWDCRLKVCIGFSYKTVIDYARFPLAFLFRQCGDYWETEEGYLQLWFQDVGKPSITIYKQADFVGDVFVAEHLIMRYVDNLDLVEKLYEKLNQKSLPSRNQ